MMRTAHRPGGRLPDEPPAAGASEHREIVSEALLETEILTSTIARMTDGSLVLHSPIALEEDAMVDLEALGTPAFLIVPSRYHRLDAPAYP